MQKQARKTLKTAYKELTEYRCLGRSRTANLALKQYQDALRKANFEWLEWINTKGDCIRQRIRNLAHFLKAKEDFGFTEFELNEYGWIKNEVFIDVEEIPLNTVMDKGRSYFNRIEIGRGPNGKWTFGYSLTYGNGGAVSSISIFDNPYNSKDEAMEEALSSVKAYMKDQFEHGRLTNRDEMYVCKVLDRIDEVRAASKQLSLF